MTPRARVKGSLETVKSVQCAYIYLKNPGSFSVVRSKPVAPGIVFDYGLDGQLIGVEVFSGEVWIQFSRPAAAQGRGRRKA
jgi:uncharacterized protein YuzE